MLKDKYILKETKAPEGYEKLTQDIEIKPEDFDSGKTAYKTIKNKKIKSQKISIAGKKIWNDHNNQDGKRPKQIVINLLKEGTKIASKIVKKEDGWKWKFDGLDKYSGGKEIKYTITEDAINGYSAEIKGYDVKNSYMPGKTSVQVTKVWKDANNKDGKRPEKVRIRLLANGKEVPGKILVLSKLNGWTGTFKNLSINKDGKKIKYTVKEEPVGQGYESSEKGNAKDGFVITNNKKNRTIIKPKEKDPKNPQTGDNTNIALYASLLGMSGIALLLFHILRRKKNIKR